MLLDDFIYDIKIMTVLKLKWDSCDAQVSPRNFHALSYRTVSHALLETETDRIQPQHGDVLFVPKKCSYHLTAGHERIYVIHFKTSAKIPPKLELFNTKDNDRLHALFAACYEAWMKKEPGYHFHVQSIFYAILEQLSFSTFPQPTGDKYQKLKPAVDRLQAGFRDPSLTIRELAQEVYMSETYFRRLFGEVYGMTPIKFLTRRRMLYAKDLLKTGLYSVETVAEMAGFADPKYFSTVFKQHTGLSPSDYKKQRV